MECLMLSKYPLRSTSTTLLLELMSLSQNRLALNIGVPARRINEIVLGKRGITAEHCAQTGKIFRNVGTVPDRPAT